MSAWPPLDFGDEFPCGTSVTHSAPADRQAMLDFHANTGRANLAIADPGCVVEVARLRDDEVVLIRETAILVGLVPTPLVKLDVTRDECAGCQLEALDGRMPLLNGKSRAAPNCSSAKARI
jgi:hypothetical protein